MKLDVNSLRYLSKDDFRVLTAVEMGQKNHEIVPIELIDSISGLKHGGAHKCVKTLLRHKLVHHDNARYDGYRLTTMGYDYLAIRTLCSRGHVVSVGRQIGVGKESDIFEVANDDGEIFALKLHRLGRTSFRAVKDKRDYLGKRRNYSWLYLSRLAAIKEFAFMKCLYEHGFPVPQAIDQNRHAVLMTLVDAKPLVQVKHIENARGVYESCMDLISRLASKGLIHCDFNEFNLLINDDEELTLIDFPQMVSVAHLNAEELFYRDVNCIVRFFSKKIGYVPEHDPELPSVKPDFAEVIKEIDEQLDVELVASGYKRDAKDMKELEAYCLNDNSEEEEEDEDEEGGDGEEEEGSEDDEAKQEGEGEGKEDEGEEEDEGGEGKSRSDQKKSKERKADEEGEGEGDEGAGEGGEDEDQGVEEEEDEEEEEEWSDGKEAGGRRSGGNGGGRRGRGGNNKGGAREGGNKGTRSGGKGGKGGKGGRR